MKKKMIALVAGALMALSASSAFASFGDMDLIRVVYQRANGTTEIASELGNVSSLIATTDFKAGDALSSAQLGLADAYVTYYAVNQTTKEFWTTGIDTTKIGSLKTATIGGVATSTYNNYNALGGTAGATTVVGSTTSGTSFKVKANNNFGGAISVGFAETQVSLAELASGAITQDLYYFNGYGSSKTGVKVGTLTLNTDGTTTVNAQTAAPVPLPAAAYLLGSGLLGLVGVRRKMNK